MRLRVEPAGRLRGILQPPPDKSITHRAAILGTMAVEPVTIRNALDASDTTSTLNAMRRLGALVEEHPEHIVVRGTGLREAAPLEEPIDVQDAGTLMRLLPGWLAGQEGRTYVLDGSAALRRRDVDRVVGPLRAMGASIETTGGHAPLRIHGRRLHAADHEIFIASAQVKSCLLLAGLSADGSTTILEPATTRDHTERLLRAAGVRVEREGRRVRVANQDELVFDPIDVPGDLSSAAFLVTAGVLVPRSRLLITRTSVNWTRTGFLRIAARMGAIVLADLEEPSDVVKALEPVSDLDVTAGPLRGTDVHAAEVPLALDELPLIALLACFAEGTTTVEGTPELRLGVSGRIDRVIEGLRGLGGELGRTEDGGFVVEGTGGLRGGTFPAHRDDRLAMLGAVAGLASREGVEVVDMDPEVSYPRFLDELARLA